ncbi:MAG: hypothetical protein QOK11_724, partial [Pseudonocardiales bacterium]|nr:hypothetical protein [Pseudonocardiales bacterium]
AAAAVRRTRVRAGAILAASRERMRLRRVEAEEHAATITRDAEQIRDRATSDAMQIREQAAAEARRLVTEAADLAEAHSSRGQRRLVEAEAGARAVREQVADEVTRTQEELHELHRTAKAEEVRTIGAARAEADALRSEARRLLADARAEVAVLTERRNAIAGELGNLSGVIEALAVADPPRSRAAEPTPAEPPPAEPPPAEAEHVEAQHDHPMSLLSEMMRPE